MLLVLKVQGKRPRQFFVLQAMIGNSARRRFSGANHGGLKRARRLVKRLTMRAMPLIRSVRPFFQSSSLFKASLLFYCCAVVLAASLFLAGGTRSGFLSDTILQLVAIPLLLIAIWKFFEVELTRQRRVLLLFVLAIAALPLIQLIPLPTWLWTILPNRQPSAEAYEIIGHAVPWMPISVSPQATWLSLLSLVPPLAILLGTLLIGYRERRWLSLLVIGIGLVSVFVGLLQVAEGEGSPLRFYAITNSSEAVGFFANRNHQAALLYCLMVFTIAWTVGITSIGKRRKYDTAQIIASVASFTALVILLAGETMARSRTGIALTMVALSGSIAFAFAKGRTGAPVAPSKKLVLGAVALAVTFSLQFALYRFLERASDLAQDDRPTFARNTMEAAVAYMPIGSGLGTFVPVYAMFEKPGDASISYVNRAHNDVLELLLETGGLGAVLMILLAIWFARRSFEIWRSAPPETAKAVDWSLARAASIVVALLIVHSFFDYPLRTGAMMAMMAFACGLMIEPPIRPECEYEHELENSRPEPIRSRRLASAPATSSVASRRMTTSDKPAQAPSEEPRGTTTSDTPAQISSLAPRGTTTSDNSFLPPDQRWIPEVAWPADWSAPSNSKEPSSTSPSSSKPPKI
jgi:O-antigen ligase